MLPAEDVRLLDVDHLEGDRSPFLQAASAMDREGVVGKYVAGIYQAGEESTSWSRSGIQRIHR